MSEATEAHYQTLSSDFSWRRQELDWPVRSEVGEDLGGVIASTTEVSWLDPSSGTLAYRGVAVERVVELYDFEQSAWLLLAGTLPENEPERFADFRRRLHEARQLPEDVRTLLCEMDPATPPSLLLRAAFSALGCHEIDRDEALSGQRQWRRTRVVGQLAALTGLLACHRAGRPSCGPEPDDSLARGMLRSVQGAEPDDEQVRLLDRIWTLYGDHGLDAPTFTSMIVASCLADPYYNITAGISALHSSHLGRAGVRVLEQLLPLEGPEQARGWARAALQRGERIAGFGHRKYRMEDPRAVILRRDLAAEARRTGREELFAVARAVEEEASAALAPKGVHVNINFYAAPLLHLLGVETALVPLMYLVGRSAGLVARVHEEIEGGRLYRPLTRYTGIGAQQAEEVGR